MSPRLPPTPKASTELVPRRTPRLSIDSSFNIEPSAITLSPTVLKQAHVQVSSSHPTNQPLSPTSPFALTPIDTPELTTQRRRASSIATANAASKRKDVVIGPPPSRQHPIIQMKPRTASTTDESATKATAGTKRKSTGVSAAKRKIARKTAHSEIERRRRSKMNDQFAKLKEMVPACKNQDMHKLAILEATTEYLAYLEEAIQTYRLAGADVATSPPTSFTPSEYAIDESPEDENDDIYEEDENEQQISNSSSDHPPAVEHIPASQSVLELTDTEATHALLLLADHQAEQNNMQRSMSGFSGSRPISVRDLLL